MTPPFPFLNVVVSDLSTRRVTDVPQSSNSTTEARPIKFRHKRTDLNPPFTTVVLTVNKQELLQLVDSISAAHHPGSMLYISTQNY
jgi:hypothetical protein